MSKRGFHAKEFGFDTCIECFSMARNLGSYRETIHCSRRDIGFKLQLSNAHTLEQGQVDKAPWAISCLERESGPVEGHSPRLESTRVVRAWVAAPCIGKLLFWGHLSWQRSLARLMVGWHLGNNPLGLCLCVSVCILKR